MVARACCAATGRRANVAVPATPGGPTHGGRARIPRPYPTPVGAPPPSTARAAAHMTDGSNPPDLYAVLGVDPTATDAEIGRAFRRLARHHHPDSASAGDASALRFGDVARAYEVLGDPTRRADYDRARHARPATHIPVHHHDPVPTARRPVGANLPAPTSVEITLDLEEAALGTTATVTIPQRATCGHCKGTGTTAGAECADCDGRGATRRRSTQVTITRVCDACGGTGRRLPGPCPPCGGSGRSRRNRSLTVRVPPGVTDGTRLRIGAPDAGGPTPTAVVRVRPHRWFGLDGRNLVLALPLSLAEAALGTTVRAPTLAGSVEVRVPPGTTPGRRLRVRGHGLPGDPPGDLVLVAEVTVPAELSDAQRLALEAYQVATPAPPRPWDTGAAGCRAGGQPDAPMPSEAPPPSVAEPGHEPDRDRASTS